MRADVSGMDALDTLWVMEQHLLSFENPRAQMRISKLIAGYLDEKYGIGREPSRFDVIRADFEWARAFAKSIALAAKANP